MHEPDSWTFACRVDELLPGDVLGLDVDGTDVALYAQEGEVFASANICTHGHARLSDGYFDGTQIECPLHQGRFDVRTGKALCAPLSQDLRTFPVRAEDGKVFIALQPVPAACGGGPAR